MKRCDILLGGRAVASAYDANGFFGRLRGLIGRTLGQGEGLLLTPCNQIHTFFMAYPIDALYMDKGGRLLRIDAQASPGKAFRMEKKAFRVLELPSGTANKLGIKTGDILEVRR